MAIVSIIGNSPSSGSTLLADLLDSIQWSACGVELDFFSNKEVYNFSKYRKNIYQTSNSPSIYRSRNGVNIDRLHSYGLNVAGFQKMVKSASNLNEFVDNFADYYLALRGKDKNSILFEKTPQNINCIGEFLSTFKNGYFIHLVRNPLYVYLSLLNRGLPKFVALMAWYFDVAKYFKYKNHERVILVKYEKLVEQPFKIVKDILKLITNKDVSEEEIKYGYGNNRYRREFSIKLKSWKVKDYGKIKNADNVIASNENLVDFCQLLNIKIHPKYAEIFDIEEISFIESIKEFNYYDYIVEELSSIKLGSEIPAKTKEDHKRLLMKWFHDFKNKDAKLSHLKYYLNPIQKI